MENLDIEHLHRLRLTIFTNAEALHKESKLLFEKSFYARAYLLSHLACEELGKIPIVVGIIGQLMSNKKPDFKKAMKRFRNHKAKIDSDDFHHYVFGMDVDLLRDSDIKWLENARADSETRVDLKNVSTYVDFTPAGPISPLDAISKDQAAEMLERAFASLGAHWHAETLTNPLVYKVLNATGLPN